MESLWNGKLDRRVIAVAKEGYAGDWAAYIGAVAGENHEQEWQEVMKHGNKLRKEVAEVLFPNFASKFVWRGA
jgi:hypothetical protein